MADQLSLYQCKQRIKTQKIPTIKTHKPKLLTQVQIQNSKLLQREHNYSLMTVGHTLI